MGVNSATLRWSMAEGRDVDGSLQRWPYVWPCVWACIGAASSCTRVSDTERFAPAEDPLAIVQTVPERGEEGVARDAAIDLCFSHTVDPRSIAPNDATMSSGETPIDSESTLQLFPWTAPGGVPVGADDDVAGPWCPGSVLSVRPKAPLFAGLHYRLRLVPRARGWNGEILDTEADGWTPEGDRFRYYLELTVDPAPDPEHEPSAEDTGTRDGGDTMDLPGPTLTDLFAAGAVFDPARDTCSCHRDTEDLALLRLDLRDVDRAYAALVLEPRPRETGFELVSPRRPSESFLVQKLLRDHDGDPLQGILGDAMPPDEPLPYRDAVRIAEWIEAGAMR